MREARLPGVTSSFSARTGSCSNAWRGSDDRRSSTTVSAPSERLKVSMT
jgi:hypothetical protein